MMAMSKNIMTPKFVQGVQAVVHGAVHGQSLAARGLCRVCSTALYVTRENKTTAPTKNKTALAYIGILHTLHTLHRPRMPTPRVFSIPALAPAHPAQPYFYQKKMEKIVCGPENVKSFNQQMREAVPEFYELAKQLRSAGLLSGLRGATLDFTITSIELIEDRLPLPHEGHYCEECISWHRLYATATAGHCFVIQGYPATKKMNKDACSKFEGAGC